MKSKYDFTTEQEWLDYLRAYFAGMAMQGLLSNASITSLEHNNNYNNHANDAVANADALIEALNKTEK